MITTREIVGSSSRRSLGIDEDQLTYWTAEDGDLTKLSSWTQRTLDAFRGLLIKAARKFPLIADPEQQEEQKHVCLFVHGYNNSWEDAARRYRQISDSMFSGDAGLGECVLFSWPSDGLKTAYYPDRLDARKTANDLAEVLTVLYDFMLAEQQKSMVLGKSTCRAKFSIIAHSMGAYVVQKGLSYAWTRNNQPLLVSLVNQLLFVAADVDNDLFRSGERVDKSDGDAVANLTYRVTALYTGLDPVLGVSAGLKHFGKRRLGRSGLDRTAGFPDNVWDVDCSKFLKGVDNVHSAYFDVTGTRDLMRDLLRGVDRRVVLENHALVSALIPA